MLRCANHPSREQHITSKREIPFWIQKYQQPTGQGGYLRRSVPLGLWQPPKKSKVIFKYPPRNQGGRHLLWKGMVSFRPMEFYFGRWSSELLPKEKWQQFWKLHSPSGGEGKVNWCSSSSQNSSSWRWHLSALFFKRGKRGTRLHWFCVDVQDLVRVSDRRWAQMWLHEVTMTTNVTDPWVMLDAVLRAL